MEGKKLHKIKNIKIESLDDRINNVEIKVACDVNNPLYGSNGAAYVYAPQKGASPEMVEELDWNLRHFAKIVKKELGKDIQSIYGGAAGGLGAGLVAFLDAELQAGIDIILEVNEFEKKIKDTDLVITGKGKIDSQTVKGKTPIGVSKKAKNYNKPVIAICGSFEDDINLVHEKGIDADISVIVDGVSVIVN